MNAIALKGLKQGTQLVFLLIMFWVGWTFFYLTMHPQQGISITQTAALLMVIPSCKCNETIKSTQTYFLFTKGGL